MQREHFKCYINEFEFHEYVYSIWAYELDCGLELFSNLKRKLKKQWAHLHYPDCFLPYFSLHDKIGEKKNIFRLCLFVLWGNVYSMFNGHILCNNLYVQYTSI